MDTRRLRTDATTTLVAEDPTADAALPAVLRPYRDHHAEAIRRIWRDTVVLGSPIRFRYRDLAAYEALSLDWYLAPDNHAAGRADAVVVEQDDQVHGYLLACLDQDHFDRWARRRAVRWGVRSLGRLPRMSRDARRFVRLRIRDGLHTWRRQPAPPFPAHMHFNLDPQVRGGHVGHHLVGWMDRRVEAAGLAGYCGELNVPAGRSLRAVVAAGGRVASRMPNRTFSWLLGVPVDRCVVARDLSERTDTVPR